MPEMEILLKHGLGRGSEGYTKGLKLTTIKAVKALGKAARRERQRRDMAWDNFTKRAFSRQPNGTAGVSCDGGGLERAGSSHRAPSRSKAMGAGTGL